MHNTQGCPVVPDHQNPTWRLGRLEAEVHDAAPYGPAGSGRPKFDPVAYRTMGIGLPIAQHGHATLSPCANTRSPISHGACRPRERSTALG
jgi:hypothetical protein